MGSKRADSSRSSRNSMRNGSDSKALKGHCAFCKLKIVEDDKLKYGEKVCGDGLEVHYFCMLLSSNLIQNGDETEGLLGFLPRDIHKELQRGSKLHCCMCSKPGATIGCALSACKKRFHYPCAVKNNAVPDFHSGSFEVFCRNHVKQQNLTPWDPDDKQCLCCYDDLEHGTQPSFHTLLCPACRRPFHKSCIMMLADKSGLHHLRCPNCKDEKTFPKACQQNGVFVPDRDAEWELQNDFEDHYIPHSVCDVDKCLCPDGRNVNIKDDPKWEVVRCDFCGLSGTHIKCSDLKDGPESPFTCNICAGVTKSPTRVPADSVCSPSSSGRSVLQDAESDEDTDIEVPILKTPLKSQSPKTANESPGKALRQLTLNMKISEKRPASEIRGSPSPQKKRARKKSKSLPKGQQQIHKFFSPLVCLTRIDK